MNNLARSVVKKIIRLWPSILKEKAGATTPPAAPARIAYFIGGGIGDAIMAFPAILFLSKVYQNTAVDIFAPANKAPLLSALFKGCSVKPLTWSMVFSMVWGKLLRTYDISFTNTIAAFKLRIEFASARCALYSQGFCYPSETPQTRLYSNAVQLADSMHDIDQNLDCAAAALHVPVTDEDRRLSTGERTHKKAGKIISVIIHPGAEKGYEYKCWPIDRYRVIVRKLIDEGCSVTILAGPSEQSAGDAFAGMPVTVLSQPDPETLFASFRAADLFVGNDSGPAHLAAWFGLGTLTVIGPVNPARTAPRGDRCVHLYSGELCSPCHFSRVSCSNRRCMLNITAESVWEALSRLKRDL